MPNAGIRTMTIDDLLSDPPLCHTDATGQPVSWGLPLDVLRFLYHETSNAHSTLETGAGLSTIVFALRGTHHTSVVPDPRQVDAITEYCRAHAVSLDRLTFRVAPSEQVLPTLDVRGLDLVLIDGRHAFPTPFLDWYYTASLLKIGGFVVIDDTQLWTGNVLRDFLSLEPEWQLERAFSKTVVFRKLAEGSHAKEWTDQLFMCQPSPSAPSL
jgi:predicted O-methyltransferase YrrM